MKHGLAAWLLGSLVVASAGACGARTGLESRRVDVDGGLAGSPASGGSAGTGGSAGIAGAGAGGVAGAGGQPACQPGDVVPCGSDVGECSRGKRVCVDGVLGPCQGDVGPVPEQCNGLDDDCDGVVDNGFNLGQACDGPDTDLCLDDVMTCNGCSLGPNNVETCNGKDDNCNGIIDADCDQGDCEPALLVTGSTPSSPNCIDFPVTAGSTGSITYPCTGGPVSAVLGGVTFTGSVTNGQVTLSGTQQITGPDNCQWRLDHTISGKISSGKLSYKYNETLLSPQPGCWQPCTETGTVDVKWQ